MRPHQQAGEEEAPSTAIIQGKVLRPPGAEGHVGRPRVERRIAACVEEHRVIVVAATAGAGKTTAVLGAMEHLALPVAWLTVDWTDSAPGRLLAYLEAALARCLPAVAGVATGALAARIRHGEAAGLLAEAVGDARVVLVVDELERLGDAPDAWAVVEAFLRYAPSGLSTVLISRRPLPAAVVPSGPQARAHASFGEAELAFTADEAAAALAGLGEADVDPAAAVEVTGGWVTGVLFEAWRSGGHVRGAGGEADPLHGYLAAHIVGQLSPEDREFLVATALLDEVTAERAVALGRSDGSARLASLRRTHLPLAWSAGGRAMRCHSRFREYLLDCLEQRGPQLRQPLHLAYGRLLAREGRDEEAVDELLGAGAPLEALACADRAMTTVIERLDFDVAERWLSALEAVVPPADRTITSARLMLELARDDHRASARLADELEATGALEPLARRSTRTAALIAWSYLWVGRLDDAERLMAIAPPGPEVDAVRFAIAAVSPQVPGGMPPVPPLTGGPFDLLVVAAHYDFGRVADLPRPPGSRLADALTEQWRIAALRASGQTQRALEWCGSVGPVAKTSVSFLAVVLPEVLIDAGRVEEARAALAEGARLARAADDIIDEWFNALAAARLTLRCDRDPVAARALLDRLRRRRGAPPAAMVTEIELTWRGLADLLDGVDARAVLQRAVDAMLAGDRLLELPTAAVYLAEAAWRDGDEEGADRAADLALDAARRQGSNHVLLQALGDFPAVAARSIDAEREAGGPWHDLGRALLAQGIALEAHLRAAVTLREFGVCAISVNGVEVRPRIVKSYELLALLATHGPEGASRDELLEALLDGRNDDAAGAYLRQAIRWLRRALPEGAIVSDGGRVRLGDGVDVRSESVVLETRLGEAARLHDIDRLAATEQALELFERGEYLPDARSRWVDERREHLHTVVADARASAAELAFAAGRYDDAQRLARSVVDADPLHEGSWRLIMRIADALADEAGVMRAYRGCERALAPLGIAPSPATKRLLEALRR